jgi:uncharacterized protein
MARQSFYITEKLGPKQSLTPEGFLLCEEVPLARTGMMIYGPDETPIKAGPDGIVRISREDADVFNETTIASALGKPVTNDHPDDDVTPESWKDLTHGVTINVRRGEGAMDDLLIGDLLITTPEGIKEVRDNGKIEISLGYEADYEETGPGMGRQTNIIINHIALVEQGRCGPRCAIGDRKPTLNKGDSMKKTPSKSKILDAMLRAFKAKDADEVEKIANEVADEVGTGEGDTHIHIHNGVSEGTVTGTEDDNIDPKAGGTEGEGRATFTDDQIKAHMDKNEAEHMEMFARIEELEKALAELAGQKAGGAQDDENEEAAAAAMDEEPELKKAMLDEVPEEHKEEAAKAKDSAYLADSFQDTAALAEILVPGIRIPTYDRAAKPGQTFKKVCGLRRQALDLAYAQPDTRAILDDILDGKELDTKKMTCDAARTLFRSAASMKRNLNKSVKHGAGTKDHGARKGPVTLAELNQLNAKRYGA